MPSIITITFNPAIDKSTSVAALIPEKKLKCTEPVYEPGGGGINVARAIKKLGGEATAVEFLYPSCIFYISLFALNVFCKFSITQRNV